MADPRLVTLPPARADEIVSLFCEAFRNYPVMRHVLGPDGYDERLPVLIGLFVAARALRGEPMFGIEDAEGRLVGAATTSRPGDAPPPEPFVALRESVWARLGAAPRQRYEAYGAVADRFRVAEPHLHLNMIGVRPSHAGRGLSRPLLDAVHALVDRDPVATGVTLSTESGPNVAYYRHVGYRVLGHAPVGDDLETWGFFRPRSAPFPTPV